MAVTCSFKKKLGHAWLYSREYKPVKCNIWAGGNCIMVITWGKSKQMQCFFSDMRHLRDYAKNCSLRWFWDRAVRRAAIRQGDRRDVRQERGPGDAASGEEAK